MQRDWCRRNEVKYEKLDTPSQSLCLGKLVLMLMSMLKEIDQTKRKCHPIATDISQALVATSL